MKQSVPLEDSTGWAERVREQVALRVKERLSPR